MAKRAKKTTKPKLEPFPSPSVVEAAPEEDNASAEDIYAHIKRLKEDAGERLAMDELLESLYDMDRPVRKEEGEEIVVSSKPFDTINLANDLVATNDPLIDVPPLEDTQAAKDEAAMVERFCAAAWFYWQRQSVEPIIDQLAHNANLLGRFCFREIYTEPDKYGLPVKLDVRNVKYSYPMFNADRELFAIAEVYERRVGDLRRSGIPGMNELLKRKYDDVSELHTVEYATWWDAMRYVIYAGGEEVHRELHGYRRLPYVYGYGRFRPSEKSEKRAVSLIAGMVNTAPSYNLLLSMILTAARRNVFTSWAHYSDRPDPIKIEDVRNEQIVQLFSNEKLEPLQRQGTPADAVTIKDILNEEMNNTGFRNLAGVGDAQSGYAFNQLSRGEKLRINPVKRSLDRALGQMFELLLDIIGKSGKSVELPVPRQPGVTDRGYSGTVKMTPALAKKYQQVFVSIPPDTLQDQTQNVAMALQVTSGQNPLLDQDTALRKFLGVTDVEGVELRKVRQMMLQLGIPAFFEQVMKPMLGMMQPMVPQGGQPPQGGAPMQPNSGMPVTTPNTPLQPDSLSGVPPAQQGDTMQQGMMNSLMGMGLPPDQAQGLAASRGTPQSSGRGR